jgi:hypothetical protein
MSDRHPINPDNQRCLLDALHRWVACAERVAKEIRDNFPIRGQDWQLGKVCKHRHQRQNSVDDVINALVWLEKEIHPRLDGETQRPWREWHAMLVSPPGKVRRVSANAARKRYRRNGDAILSHLVERLFPLTDQQRNRGQTRAFHVGLGIVFYQPMCRAVQTLVDAYEDILDYYGLVERIAEGNPVSMDGVAWPPRTIPGPMLAHFERAAARLKESTEVGQGTYKPLVSSHHPTANPDGPVPGGGNAIRIKGHLIDDLTPTEFKIYRTLWAGGNLGKHTWLQICRKVYRANEADYKESALESHIHKSRGKKLSDKSEGQLGVKSGKEVQTDMTYYEIVYAPPGGRK